MADTNESIEILKTSILQLVDTLGTLNTTISSVSKSYKRNEEDVEINNQSLEEFEKSVQSVIEGLDGGKKVYKDTFAKFGESGSKVIHSFKDLQASVDNIATQNEQYDAQKLLNEKRKEYIISRSKDILASGLTQAGSAAVTFTQELQKATPNVASGASLLGSAIDVAGSAGSALGGILSNVGSALAVIPGLGVVVGTGLAVVGGALSTFSEQTAKLLKSANDIFSVEFQKTEAAFYSLNASGAVFADGMTGMKTAANSVGLTLDIFSNIVKNNAETIAKSGLGVSDGAVKVGKILNREGGQLRESLLNLGYSVEEQAELTAMTMRDMRASGQTLRATDAQVAQQTKEYAANLRLISSITGEDAKARMERARQAATNIAFQAKLAKMDEEQRQKVVTAMGAMTEVQQKNFMDTVLFGSVINREGAAMAATIPAMAKANSEFISQFNAGTMDVTSVLNTIAKYGEAAKNQMLSAAELGLAAAAGVGGIGAAVGELMSKELQNLLPVTKEAVAKASESVASSIQTTDKMTQEFNGVVNNMLQSAVNMEKIFLETGGLETYAQVLSKTSELMTGVTQMMLDANGMLKKSLGVSPNTATVGKSEKEISEERIKEFANNLGEKLTKEQSGILKEYERATKLLVDSSMDAGFSEQRYEEAKRQFDAMRSSVSVQNIEGKGSANGNILKGPESGYKALLHGVEAVVPLPDGRTVPVELNGNINSGLSREDRSILENMARIEDIISLKESVENQQRNLREMTDLFARAVDVLGEQRDISREMLHVLY